MRLTLAIATVLMLVAIGASTQAEEECRLADLRGHFAGHIAGAHVVSPTILAGPAATLTIITVDGHGNVTGSDVVSFNGTIVPRTFAGTVTISPDCTGSGTFTVLTPAGFPDIHISFALTAKTREIHFILTNPGLVAAGSLVKE